MTENKRLINPPRGFHPNRVSDLLVILMANVEEALLDSGATPNVDYNRLDLLQAATPFVVSMFNDNTVEFVTEWPDLQHDDQRG